MAKSRFTTVIASNDITITYDGKEVLYWMKNEWVEDPTVVISIANAMRMAYETPEVLLLTLRELGKLQ